MVGSFRPTLWSTQIPTPAKITAKDAIADAEVAGAPSGVVAAHAETQKSTLTGKVETSHDTSLFVVVCMPTAVDREWGYVSEMKAKTAVVGPYEGPAGSRTPGSPPGGAL